MDTFVRQKNCHTKIMKKLFFVTLLLLCTAAVSSAQQRRSTIGGVVADSFTHEGLIGITIEVIPVADSTKRTMVISGAGGLFSTGVDRQEINVRASMYGYDTIVKNVNVTEARHILDTIYIQQSATMLDAVAVSGFAMRTSVKGDTLQYNADAFKVTADADVSSLLQKMPGITVNGSSIEIQGETVQKVLLDGKEFFGTDVGAAISQLPAEAIKNIEVFNKLSDNAEFTGIDDGESYKTINLVTREAMRTMITGKVNGLYGIEPPKYDGDDWHHFGLVGGNVNILNNESRLTIGGNLNNINERSFTFNDPLDVGDDDIARVGRFQMSYRNLLGKKKTWDVNGSYSYTVTDSERAGETDRTYYESDDPTRPFPWSNYYSKSGSTSLNNGHNFNTRIEFQPNPYHRLMIRAGASYQGNSRNSNGLETYIPTDGGEQVDLNNWEVSNGKDFSSNLMAMYSVRLGKPGRTITVSANGNYNPERGDDEEYNERPELPTRWSAEPFRDLGYGIGGGISYTEPLGENSLIALDYSVNHNYSDNDRKAYLKPYLENGTWGDFDMSAPDPTLSGVFSNTRTMHRIGPRFSVTKNETTFVAGVGYQYMMNEVDRVLPEPLNLKADFNNLTYNMMLRSRITEGHQLRVDVRSRMANPSVTDLQDIPNITNSANITRGNPNLKSSYSNSFSANYNISMIETGRTLSFFLGGSQTSNSLGRRVLINSEGFPIYNAEGVKVDSLDAVGRYTEPINMNGAWDAWFGTSFGFPVTLIRSNVNLNAGLSYSESPSQTGVWTPDMMNNGMPEPKYTTNYRSTISPNGGITIGSNISEKVDFYVSYNIGYSNERNTFSTNSNNETLNHRLRANYKFILPLSFTWSGNVSYRYDKQMTRKNSDDEYLMINMSVGKKVFRSKLGEVNLFVNNLLDRNDSFRRNYATDYFESAIRSTIGRYFGVSFTWNIRNFKGSSSQGSSVVAPDGQGGAWQQGRPGGMPAGGPPMGGGRGGFGGGGGRGGGRGF
jgi:hypothetical protein